MKSFISLTKCAYFDSLRGLFIWAIDQDTYENSLLDAVLQPDGLGKFRDVNGAVGDGQDWRTVDLDGSCFWSSKPQPLLFPIETLAAHISSRFVFACIT